MLEVRDQWKSRRDGVGLVTSRAAARMNFGTSKLATLAHDGNMG
jgi:hypothetical protein